MTTFVKFLVVLCALVKYSQESVNVTDSGRKLVDDDLDSTTSAPSFGRLSDRKAKPLRSIFMGLYRNYKSTYLGNKTSLEYRKSLKDADQVAENRKSEGKPITKKNRKVKGKKKSKRGTVKKSDPLIYSYDNEYRYEIGQGVNVTLDMNKDMVSVNLDEENIKDILLGIWNSEDEESGEACTNRTARMPTDITCHTLTPDSSRALEDKVVVVKDKVHKVKHKVHNVAAALKKGRGKKHHEMLTKILPLFILPFLIQSAIVPFIVSKLKLLLLKSIIVGKIAIFIMIISALKNSPKHMSYHDTSGGGYWGGEPSRRSEAFNMEKNGYKFETKPPITSWDN